MNPELNPNNQNQVYSSDAPGKDRKKLDPKILIGVLVVVVVLVVAAVAMTSSKSGTKSDTDESLSGLDSASSSTVQVAIASGGITPADLAVNTNANIQWVNSDSVAHTVSSDEFASEVVQPGDSFSHIFKQPGTYNYKVDNFVGTVTAKN